MLQLWCFVQMDSVSSLRFFSNIREIIKNIYYTIGMLET